MSSEATRETLQRVLQEVRTLRDEIGVKIHLGGMEAKDAFAALEPKLREIEHEVRERGEQAKADLHDRLEELRAALQKAGGHLL